MNAKKYLIAFLGLLFLTSLVLVQYLEIKKKEQEISGVKGFNLTADSQACYDCHMEKTPGIIGHWVGSKHANLGIGCYECHKADEGDLDGWVHEGKSIATIVTPKDCGSCHADVVEEFSLSHHAKGGNILHSLDNTLAEVVEGHRGNWQIANPHNPGEMIDVNGAAFANSGCQQCHGSQVAFKLKDGGSWTPWSLKLPEAGGKAEIAHSLAGIDASQIERNAEGKPIFDSKTWPNTGIGRLNLDGSRGSCTACHSRHDFSPRRARQPENCGKCHLGPDHPQKEIYEESKHGVAYRDLKDDMNLDADTWVVGKDYSAAPTCTTCHMSATRNQPVTHDPGKRISWNNRPAVSVKINRPEGTDQKMMTADERRANMQDVCVTCHSPDYVRGFYKQYDDFVNLYNAKYALPGSELMKLAYEGKLLSKVEFDEEVEWTWFYLWHHEGRRARHGTSMMAPDYAHWHGTYEVAERWYVEFVPQLREVIAHGKEDEAKKAAAEALEKKLDEILSRPEHQWNQNTGVKKPAGD